MSYVAQSGTWDDIVGGVKKAYGKGEEYLTKAKSVKSAAEEAKAKISGGGGGGGGAPPPGGGGGGDGGGIFGLPTWAVLGGAGVLALVLLKKRG